MDDDRLYERRGSGLGETEYSLLAAETDRQAPSLDLHGRHVDEAISELELFLDRNFMAGKENCKIIFGIGTGKLRAAVLDVLRASQLVKVWKENAGGGSAVAVLYKRG